MSDLDPHCIHKQSISLQYLLAPGVKIIKKIGTMKILQAKVTTDTSP